MDSADRLPAARIGNIMDGRCTLLLTVFLAAPHWCAAQGFDGDAMPTSNAPTSNAPTSNAPTSNAPTTPKMLVMVDGTVLEGRFTPRPDGYDMTTRAGRMFIGSDQVRFTALDLADAYQRMQGPQHARSSDASDPLHAARAAEVTSLWRLQALG